MNYADLVKFTTTKTGTGLTGWTGFVANDQGRLPAAGGVIDGLPYPVFVQDSSGRIGGTGVFSASGTIMAFTPVTGSMITLSGTAVVYISPLASNLNPWYWAPPLASSVSLRSGDATNVTLTDDPDVGLIAELAAGATTGYRMRGYEITVPVSGDWWVAIRLQANLIPLSNAGGVGIQAFESATLKYYGLQLQSILQLQARRGQIDGLTGAGATTFTTTAGPTAFLRVTYNSAATTYTLAYSISGKKWVNIETSPALGYMTTKADKCFIGIMQNDNSVAQSFVVDHLSKSF
ncbi:MAG TPA: hypothetical protein VKB96_10935 [Gammaproteobacteria bacterium]|nr:hypothetical protein [Gammaproteobacteria bacterium]